MIYSVARKAGLSEAEAQDVVQDTVLSVAKKIGAFRSDPAAGSFKAWLLQLTRWRILNQVKRRLPCATGDSGAHADDESRTTSSSRASLDDSECAGRLGFGQKIAKNTKIREFANLFAIFATFVFSFRGLNRRV
ncbi:MAG: sigma-70 family RNA polymerase sigma factor [Verrucomicrobia bacterium]|nr:sigma-70 family RNA polymerase sigma factor [Verrucomicrobiota bacterium]